MTNTHGSMLDIFYFFFLSFLSGESHTVVLRAYSWLCSEGHSWWGSGEYMWGQGSSCMQGKSCLPSVLPLSPLLGPFYIQSICILRYISS